VNSGDRFGRIYAAHYTDPLGFGKTRSRFSDPRRRIDRHRFGVLYLGQTLTVCFLEAVLRDQRDGIIGPLVMAESELTGRLYAEVAAVQPLDLVDLRGDAAVALGIPSDAVRGRSHTLGRAWSAAFHDHPQAPDGIIYPSRLNGEVNLAVYDRAVSKLVPVRLRRLIDVPDMAPILDRFQVGLMGPT
jgi:hypothetical protein